ncbi:MAG: hypothetical protein ABI806_00855 [Candidatus Solibacter sp.]
MSGLRLFVFGALSLGLVGGLWAANSGIGTATAKGTFAVNQSKVSGTATLFDGTKVETGAISSRLQLINGSRIDLNANSSVTVHGSDAVLETGSGEIGVAAGFNLQARTLRIETEGASGRAEVRLTGEHDVQVKALAGPVKIFSKTGVLVAMVNPGMGLMLDPYAAPADDFDMSGCLLKQASGPLYGLAVDSALYQLMGANLGANVGSRVHIVGTRGTGGALKGSQASVTMTKIEVTAAGGCLAAANRFTAPAYDPMTAGSGGPGKVEKAGMTSQTKAIIAGVAIAGAGGGIAAAVCCKSK